jgi:hypothetical protein
MAFSCRLPDSLPLEPHFALRSILLNAGTLRQINPRCLGPTTSEINQALSLPRLAIIASKSQAGDDADPESTHVAPSVNEKFSFQVNPASGE